MATANGAGAGAAHSAPSPVAATDTWLSTIRPILWGGAVFVAITGLLVGWNRLREAETEPDDARMLVWWAARNAARELPHVRSALARELAAGDRSAAEELIHLLAVLSPQDPALPADRARAAALAYRTSERAIHLRGEVRMHFALIPAGSFAMGRDDGAFDQRPAHPVTLARAYYLSRTEVTQDQWVAVMENNPSLYRGLRRPVDSVNFADCSEFLRRIESSVNTELGPEWRPRLPTEAEWEHACRTGAGESAQGGVGAFAPAAWTRECELTEHHPVALLPANRHGLYDLRGNVSEWCGDWYGPYAVSAQEDPLGAAAGVDRVLRGGDWTYPAELLSCSARDRARPELRLSFMGLRVALVRAR